jgi:HlyD family secretion protein
LNKFIDSLRNGPIGKVMAWPQRKKIIWGVAALAAVAALVVGFNTFRRQGQNQLQPGASGSYQTEAAQVGVLVDTVSATGNVEANQLALLNWQTTGIVEDVNVSEGQQVKRGDTLATLQLSSVPEEVISAQADLLTAKQDLQDFYDSFTGVALATAQQTVADAQQTYEDALYTHNSLLSPSKDLTVQDAYAAVVLARAPLDKALKNYEKLANRPQDNANRAHAVQALADAQSVYDAAVRTYNALAGTATDTETAVAAADLAVAQAAFTDAQAEYERLVAGPTAEEIAAAEANVAAAEAVLNQRLIQAPFDGTVTLAKPQVGDYVKQDEAAFELQNPTSYFVEIQVNELDINQIEVGQNASVVLDAMTDVTYPAQVVKVGSIGNESSGVVTFTVIVQITAPDENIKSGMTSVVEVETSTDKEGLLIPNQAIRLENGQQIVYVMGPDGSLNPVPVTIGSSSTTHSEVVEGNIQPGDLIVLNPPTTVIINNNGGFFFRGGGPAGGDGGGQPPVPQGGNGG